MEIELKPVTKSTVIEECEGGGLKSSAKATITVSITGKTLR